MVLSVKTTEAKKGTKEAFFINKIKICNMLNILLFFQVVH